MLLQIRKLQDKLRGSRGETLVETLVAILVAALSVALLFTCATASGEINKMAREVDGPEGGYYEALSKAETQDLQIPTPTPAPGATPTPVPGATPAPTPHAATVTVTGSSTSVPVSVKLYGEKGIYSYK